MPGGLGQTLRGLVADTPKARALRAFGLVTLAPVLLLVAGVLVGGFWAWAGLLFITLVVWAMDRFIAGAAPHVPEAEEFPAATRLSVTLGLVHFLLLALTLWAVAGDSGLALSDRIAILVGAGLWFGQVSNANAHELIHRRDRWLFRLGAAVYISLLFGHHTSAHRHVHHRFVATPEDPNSARRGESFYGFALRAWPGSFVAGYEMESALRARARLPWWRVHPYVFYVGGAVLCLVLVFAAFGAKGIVAYLALCAHAQTQLLMSDYVQHYGLVRAALPGGRHEPAGARHSWDAPHWASSALTLNAPRHADHHARPARAYPSLEMPDEAPRLPFGLPLMGVIALVPRLWFRMMNRRLPRDMRGAPMR